MLNVRAQQNGRYKEDDTELNSTSTPGHYTNAEICYYMYIWLVIVLLAGRLCCSDACQYLQLSQEVVEP